MNRLAATLALALLSAGQVLASEAPACDRGPGALGTSRVIEVDAAGGPTFGQQYPPTNLLQPGEVVLTFDDGPHPTVTKDILDALAAECAKATFFYVGSMLKAFPGVARDVLAQGHTIGTHTWSHRNLGATGYDSAVQQVESTFVQADQVLPGKVAPFFRFPYLSDNKRVLAYLKTRNVATFSIDVDSVDYRARTPERVLNNVMTGLAKSGGGIILFHDIHANTARALPEVLRQLKAGGFKVVHLVAKAPVVPVAASVPMAKRSGGKPRRQARRGRKPATLTWF